MVDRIGENYILKATLDEFDEYRMKKNMSDYMKWKEKVTSIYFEINEEIKIYEVSERVAYGKGKSFTVSSNSFEGGGQT